MDWNASTVAIAGTGAFIVGAAIVVVIVALFIWLFMQSTGRKTIPVACLLFGLCLELFFVKQPYLQLGLQIYPNDVISLFVLLSALAGVFHRPVPIYHGGFVVWLALGGTIILSFVLGLAEFGRYAGTEVRPFFYIWVAGLYCAMADFDEADLRRIGRWCLWTAYAIIGIALYLWAAVETGWIPRAELFGDEGGAVFRPVGSHGVFFVATVAMVQTMAWLRGTGTTRSGWHAAVLLTFVLILQHRSVWIATLAGLLMVMALERRHLPRRFPLLLAFVLVVMLGVSIAVWFGHLDELGRRLAQSTLSMTDSGGTFAARIDGWIRLFESWVEGSVRVLMFGFPFGKGYTRYYNGQLIEFAPHNFFLDLLLRVGVIGLLLFLVATAMAIVYTWRSRADSEVDYLIKRGLAVGLVASLVYYVAYHSFYVLGAATGIALALMMRRKKTAPVANASSIAPRAEPPQRPASRPPAPQPLGPASSRYHPNAAVHDGARRR
jgi:hypothetical protein